MSIIEPSYSPCGFHCSIDCDYEVRTCKRMLTFGLVLPLDLSEILAFINF